MKLDLAEAVGITARGGYARGSPAPQH